MNTITKKLLSLLIGVSIFQGSLQCMDVKPQDFTPIILSNNDVSRAVSSILTGFMLKDNILFFKAIQMGKPISWVEFHPKKEEVIRIGLKDNTVRFANIETGKEVQKIIEETPQAISSLNKLNSNQTDQEIIRGSSPDGKVHITLSMNGYMTYLWKSAGNDPLCTLTGHPGRIISVVFTPDRKAFITNSDDGKAYLWNPSTGCLICTLKGHISTIISALLSTHGKFLITKSDNGTVHLWKVSREELTGKLICQFIKGTWCITSIACCPDEKIILIGLLDGTVHVRDIETGALLKELEGHTSYITSLAFNSNGDTIATASEDGTIILWKHFPDDDEGRKKVFVKLGIEMGLHKLMRTPVQPEAGYPMER